MIDIKSAMLKLGKEKKERKKQEKI